MMQGRCYSRGIITEDDTYWSPLSLSADVSPIHQHYKEIHLENLSPVSALES